MIDLRVLLVAATVASPAAYRASQGLLTLDQALTRFALVALACTAMSVLVRALWPIVAGPAPEQALQPATPERAETADMADDAGGPLVSPRPE